MVQNQKILDEVKPGTVVLLHEKYAITLNVESENISLFFKIYAEQKESSWVVNIEISSNGLLRNEKIEKQLSLEEGQRVMIGCYQSSIYQRPYNLYVNLVELFPHSGKTFSLRNDSLCTLHCVPNGVMASSQWAVIRVFER